MKIVKLKDIATNVYYGSMPKTENIVDRGYPIFSGYRYVGFSSIFNISEETLIVVARGVGGTGDVKIAPPKTFLTNLSIAVELDKSKVDLKYACYYMQKQGLRYLDTGAAQSQITINNLKSHKLQLPPLPTQQKIASILSTYDNLIQNYKKQIEDLQTCASELYKEWFVRFRFPGYQTTQFENGIPVGWEYVQLKDFVKFDRGISYSSEEIDCEDGVNLINLKNIEAYGGFRRDGTKKYNGKYKTEQVVTQGDLVMGITDMTQDRRTVGSVALIPYVDGICVISADLLKVTTSISKTFFYSLCKFGPYSRYFSMFANGANVLHLRPDALLRKKVLLPSENLISKYDSIVKLMVERMDKANIEIDNLTQQRDLLLPRLMSGKLEVK